jgi:DNA processing protein
MTPDSKDIKYWIALSNIKDIGPVTSKKLLSALHCPENIFKADFNTLKNIEGVGEFRAQRIKNFNEWDAAEKEASAVKQRGIRIITYADLQYPINLRQVEDAPVFLYAKGSIEDTDRYAVAMVGSREMSDYGRAIACKIAGELASCGITIISGMARGIDAMSHLSALSAGGRSIAVLGCGIERPYPYENKGLYAKLINAGCVISEFPIGTPPLKENFPKRNRLISGLSLGVIVIEAALKSGSLITANYALEQGRDVFAVPGSVTSKGSEGTNWLIKKGAKLVQKTEDIIEELSPQLKGILKESSSKYILPPQPQLEINPEEKAICNILGQEPLHIDMIARKTGFSAGKLSALLSGLEIKGVIRQAEGKRFFII